MTTKYFEIRKYEDERDRYVLRCDRWRNEQFVDAVIALRADPFLCDAQKAACVVTLDCGDCMWWSWAVLVMWFGEVAKLCPGITCLDVPPHRVDEYVTAVVPMFPLLTSLRGSADLDVGELTVYQKQRFMEDFQHIRQLSASAEYATSCPELLLEIMPQLTHLVLDTGDLYRQFVRRLPDCAIEDLSIIGLFILGNEEMQRLCDVLPQTTITRLELSFTTAYEWGRMFSILLDALPLCPLLTTLDLAFEDIEGDDEIDDVDEEGGPDAPRTPRTAHVADRLARVFHLFENTAITTLDLQYIRFSASNLLTIAKAMETNTVLTTLRLADTAPPSSLAATHFANIADTTSITAIKDAITRNSHAYILK